MATEAAPAPPADSDQALESPGGRRFRIAEYAGFAPALILYGVFFAVPLGIIVAYSFWKVVDYNVVYSWLNILGDQGAINRLLQWMHLTDHPVSFFLYDRPAVVLVLVYLYFPFAALTLYASLERFDWDQFKAAMDLGARPLTAMRRILLPQIKPGLTTAVIFVFIPILGEYLAPQLVGGARGVMIGNLIVNFFQGAQYTRGAAAALLIAALIVLLLTLFRRSLEVEDPYGT